MRLPCWGELYCQEVLSKQPLGWRSSVPGSSQFLPAKPPWSHGCPCQPTPVSECTQTQDWRVFFFSISKRTSLRDNSPQTEHSPPVNACWRFIGCECKSSEIRSSQSHRFVTCTYVNIYGFFGGKKSILPAFLLSACFRGKDVNRSLGLGKLSHPPAWDQSEGIHKFSELLSHASPQREYRDG